MRNSILKVSYLVFVFCLVIVTSCSKDGEIGAIGPQGIQGEVGPEGSKGEDGEEGNVNVQTYTFNTSTLEGDKFVLDFPELTQDILDDDAILTYVERSDLAVGSAYFSIPGISFDESIEVELTVGQLTIYFYERTSGNATVVPGSRYDLVKVVVIESSNTISGKTTKKEWLPKLKTDGVNLNNYHQVANYFGLED